MKQGAIVAQGSYEQVSKSKTAEFDKLLAALEKGRSLVQQKSQENEVVAKEDQEKFEDKHFEELEGEHEELHFENNCENLNGSNSETEKANVKVDVKEKQKQSNLINLTGSEERGVGQVSREVYLSYIQNSGGNVMLSFLLFCFLLRTAADFLTTRWLAFWSASSVQNNNFVYEYSQSPIVLDKVLANHVLSSYDLFASLRITSGHSANYFLGIFAFLSVLSVFFIIVSVIVLMFSSLIASRQLHNKLLLKVSTARMSFFDTTPLGRILNRFSKDVYTIDEVLPGSFLSFLGTVFAVLGTVFSIAYVAPAFLISIPILFIFYRKIQQYYIATSRELQRWDSVLRSPIYSFFTETLEGVSTIRAFAHENRFIARNFSQLENNLRAYYLTVSANRWLAIRLEFIGTFLVIFAAVFVVLQKKFHAINENYASFAALTGLALTYALNITQTLNWTVRMTSELETNIVSVERLNDYNKLESEQSVIPSHTKQISVISSKEMELWPQLGHIEFRELRAKYRDNLPFVLKGISFKVHSGEKIGIVGRTGSGKSTLFLCLLRLLEPCFGEILLDGIDIQSVDIHLLRSKISVVPQDTLMFTGTLRSNLDPLEQCSDQRMLAVLNLCKVDEQLNTLLNSININNDNNGKERLKSILDLEVTEAGSNFSFGTRQLFSLCRALLRDCRILLLDEASSGIDLATDSQIQDMITNEFQACTVLTVAHRIETILHSDKVLVMSEGKVAEFDTPKSLLEDEKSKFAALVKRMQQNEKRRVQN